MFISWVVWIKPAGPSFHGGFNLIVVAPAQFATGAVAGPDFREF